MKNIHIIWIVLSLMMIGCKKNVSLENGDVIMIDVAKDGYSQKEIILQDFMDVEYIALDSSDDFLCQGQVLAVGAKIIVVRNDIQDGDIYLFDRKKGTGIRKNNRKGNGNEEYTIAYNVVLDEDNEELFVNDVMQNKIIVYDLSGNYKRHFSRYEKARINQIYNFDKEKLICKIEDDNVTLGKSTFIVISKQTGEVVIETSISYKEKKMMKIADGGNLLMFYSYPSILHFQNHWIFSEVSSDTVFKFSPEHDRVPVIIKRPSIQSMLPEVFLFPKIFTNRYCFIEKVKKETKFSTVNLVYDRKENELYEYVLYNGDYSNARKINMADIGILNDEVIFYQRIEAYELVDARNNGNLKGVLRNIAVGLNEESNPIIMLVKDKY